MNDYEARQEEKRQRYAELADKAKAEAAAEYRKADLREEASGIPFGQPILVGHHSERRHRNAIKRADNAMRRSIEADEKAKYYERKAETYGQHGISADDPEAVIKLREKLAGLEQSQETMKAANRIIRSKPKEKVTDEKLAKLADIGISESNARQLFEPDFCGRIGFPGYALQNNNANIRRVKQRIDELKAKPTTSTSEQIGAVEVIENAELNRVQLIFPGKPSAEVRAELKSNGFRWAPSNKAWQRHLSSRAVNLAKNIAANFTQ